jgi:hypothetical protein
MTHTRLYQEWAGIKNRCVYSGSSKYKYYGARGISMCSEWAESFIAFAKWAKENGYADNLTIERLDYNGDYCPENCTWIPKSEQGKNTRYNFLLTYNGKTQTIAQWSRELNIKRACLEFRYHKGWEVEDILNPIKCFSKKRTFITYNGETKSITSWAKELHIHTEKLKRLLENKSFDEVYRGRLTII